MAQAAINLTGRLHVRTRPHCSPAVPNNAAAANLTMCLMWMSRHDRNRSVHSGFRIPKLSEVGGRWDLSGDHLAEVKMRLRPMELVCQPARFRFSTTTTNPTALLYRECLRKLCASPIPAKKVACCDSGPNIQIDQELVPLRVWLQRPAFQSADPIALQRTANRYRDKSAYKRFRVRPRLMVET